MVRGGKRTGAGRPKNKEVTINFHRRVTKEEYKKLDNFLKKIREKEEPK